jgi:hypothetical protein
VTTPPPIRIPGYGSGALLTARAAIMAGEAFAQVIPPLNADIERENQNILALLMILALDDDDESNRLRR